MKISLITACYNSAGTIRTAMDSVLEQKCVDVEYIVVDGGSTDGTVDMIKKFEVRSSERSGGEVGNTFEFKWLSEKDRGMYDAINKGIKMSTGDVVGILNADDVLAADDTLAKIVSAFNPSKRTTLDSQLSTNNSSAPPLLRSSAVDCVYADIRFVREGRTVDEVRSAKTVRYCSAKCFRPWMFRFAVMVPHPSFYCRRELFAKFGAYSLDYRICADFELVMRYMWKHRIRSRYLNEDVVVMRMGGASTSGVRSNIVINREDLKALKANGCWSAMWLIYFKYLFKIWGFVFVRRNRS